MAVLRDSNGNGCRGMDKNKESCKGISEQGELQGDQLENLCNIDSNPKCSRWFENKQPTPEREFDFEGVRGEVPHTIKNGCSKIGELESKQQKPGFKIISSISKSEFSNTNCKRLERTLSQKERGRSARFSGGMEDKWGGKFESIWQVEPSMGRLVDGATDWVDKLRILGNGVVPQQAAYAFQILGERLACGIVEKRTPND